jgi:hypothetical protein
VQQRYKIKMFHTACVIYCVYSMSKAQGRWTSYKKCDSRRQQIFLPGCRIWKEILDTLKTYITSSSNYIKGYLLMWRIWWAPNNASKRQMGFNWAFRGLNTNTVRYCKRLEFLSFKFWIMSCSIQTFLNYKLLWYWLFTSIISCSFIIYLTALSAAQKVRRFVSDQPERVSKEVS